MDILHEKYAEKIFINKREQMKGAATTIIALITGLVNGAVATYAIPPRPAEKSQQLQLPAYLLDG